MYYPTEDHNIEDIDYLNLLKKMCTIQYKRKHIIKFIIWYTSGYMIVFICTLQVVLFLQPETSLQTTLECAVPLAIVIQMGLKNLLYAHRNKKILSLKKYIEKNFWPLSCTGDNEFEEEARKNVKLLEYACALHLFSTFFSVVFYCHYPLMEYGPDELPLPMKIWEEQIFKKFKWSWYFNGIVMELAFYCLAGSYLEYQSEKLLPTSYQSQWYLGNKIFRKKLILLEKISLERIVNISAFGVIPIGNLSLLQLFKIAFSCITVLQAMNEKTDT
ncbi:hypothetical protein CBL_14525 [Carabus blaptoides fortunei]